MALYDANMTPTRFALPRLLGHDPMMAGIGLIFALSLAVTVPAYLWDTRMFQGENIWAKPIKFQIALTIYALTLAIYARWLPKGFLQRPAMRAYLTVVVICMLGEMIWIGGAAMFGTASHFNIATPAMAAIYSVMGIMAVTLTSASLVYGIAIWRNAESGLDPVVRLSVALGLILTFVLTVPTAGVLASQLGHHVGTPVTGAKVPLLGWSREVGDLRVAHFFATHALHGLPIVGLVAAELARGRMIVWSGSAVYAILTFVFLQQALAGQPLIGLN